MVFPKSFTTVTTFSKLLALSLFIFLPFLGFYLGVQYRKIISSDKKISKEIIVKKLTSVPVENQQKYIIITSLTSPNGKYTAVIKQVNPELLQLEKEGATFILGDGLEFRGTACNSLKKYSLKELVTDDMYTFDKNSPIQFSLNLHLLDWTSDERYLWGVVSLNSSADPPAYSQLSFFKIDTKDWTVTKDLYPGQGYFLVPTSEKFRAYDARVLIEAISDNSLSLSVYSINDGKIQEIVKYPAETFSELLPGKYPFLSYFYPGLLGENKTPRQLNTKWGNGNTLSYLDFVTRKEIIKKLE